MNYAGPELAPSIDIDRRGYDGLTYDGSQNNLGKSARLSGNLGVLGGLLILVAVAMAFIALATWSINDPSLSNANGKIASNWMGFWGASFADILIQFFGLGAAISLFPPAIIGWMKILRQPFGHKKSRALCWPLMTILASAAIACLSVPETWPLPSGLGGIAGDMMLKIPALFTGSPPSGWFAVTLFFAFGIPAFVLALYSGGLINRNTNAAQVAGELAKDEFDEGDIGEDDDTSLAFGAFAHWYLSIKSRLFKSHKQKARQKAGQRIYRAGTGISGNNTTTGATNGATKGSGNGIWRKIFGWINNGYHKLTGPEDDGLENFHGTHRHEPNIDDQVSSAQVSSAMPGYGEQIYDAIGDDLAADFQAGDNSVDPQISGQNSAASPAVQVQPPGMRVQPMAPSPKQSARNTREAQTSMFGKEKFELPSLHLLSEPKNIVQDASLTNDALEQNARLLEGVLGDFGVKGEIVNVRPGPVVTLYELEPAPGIKSSRVIGLADDIARSMSAISARVAVVPGRNAIGIELPNQRRETVYLREVLASQLYEKSKAKLPIVLGKNIGGEPVIADLAKMPHLLVAGTTGSGKSVAINTMILSILYRLTPDQVKMIMIDPKMLELSVYDGIPHLLTPVVTDPKKAVVALKWTVREMEERYKTMSKLGVRNIDGYNMRLTEAAQKNEVITKTVQTGFDRETGEAIYQSEELDLHPMPYIVVVIDEMADLMMVAGKDIEGTVQRLAQMARAAGIHVVMATQRPSVDVITGTIKANFPTRISFQVTSKIDSRTILGEQGAEQLLGMGDMLYQAGGGRTVRVHGPFVDDDEVEKITNHLKTQGTPDYLHSVTEEIEGNDTMDGGTIDGGGSGAELSESNDIYDRAVAIVLSDRKVSTSYIQRRLSIGYNRAATLIERMEQEGLISSANHAGKREILVPAEDETM